MANVLDLRRLRYFQATANEGSLSAAARLLNVSQPALTHHIAELERTLGLQVFERRPRGIVLTSAGQVLLHHANCVLDAVHDAEESMKFLSRPSQSSKLTIGMVQSVSCRLAPELISEIDSKVPGVSLEIRETSWVQSHSLVERGDIDLAVTWERERSTTGIPLVWQSFALGRIDIQFIQIIAAAS